MNALAAREPKRETVPSDFLSEWIRRGTLLSLILDAAQTIIQTYKLAHEYGLRTVVDDPANCEQVDGPGGVGAAVNPNSSELIEFGPDGSANMLMGLPESARKLFFKFEFGL